MGSGANTAAGEGAVHRRHALGLGTVASRAAARGNGAVLQSLDKRRKLDSAVCSGMGSVHDVRSNSLRDVATADRENSREDDGEGQPGKAMLSAIYTERTSGCTGGKRHRAHCKLESEPAKREGEEWVPEGTADGRMNGDYWMPELTVGVLSARGLPRPRSFAR